MWCCRGDAYLERGVVEVTFDDEEGADLVSDDGGVSFALPADQRHFAEALARLCKATAGGEGVTNISLQRIRAPSPVILH